MDKIPDRERRVLQGLDRAALICALTEPKNRDNKTPFTLRVLEGKEDIPYNFWVTSIEDHTLVGVELKVTGRASNKVEVKGGPKAPPSQRYEDAEDVIFLCNINEKVGRLMFF